VPFLTLTLKAAAITHVYLSGPRNGEFLAADEVRFTPLAPPRTAFVASEDVRRRPEWIGAAILPKEEMDKIQSLVLSVMKAQAPEPPTTTMDGRPAAFPLAKGSILDYLGWDRGMIGSGVTLVEIDGIYAMGWSGRQSEPMSEALRLLRRLPPRTSSQVMNPLPAGISRNPDTGEITGEIGVLESYVNRLGTPYPPVYGLELEGVIYLAGFSKGGGAPNLTGAFSQGIAVKVATGEAVGWSLAQGAARKILPSQGSLNR
jgi:hypothetical protein